jgi:hypothetical protein
MYYKIRVNIKITLPGSLRKRSSRQRLIQIEGS